MMGPPSRAASARSLIEPVVDRARGGVALAIVVKLTNPRHEVAGEFFVESGRGADGGLLGGAFDLDRAAPGPALEIGVGPLAAVEHRDGVDADLETIVEGPFDGTRAVGGLDLDGNFFPVHDAHFRHLPSPWHPR